MSPWRQVDCMLRRETRSHVDCTFTFTVVQSKVNLFELGASHWLIRFCILKKFLCRPNIYLRTRKTAMCFLST